MNTRMICLLMSLGVAGCGTDIHKKEYMAQRERMVSEQIASRGISDVRVLEAMRSVERHLFIPPEFRFSAYGDHPVSIGHGQTISQPFIVAYMTAALQLKGDERVLEIGTGSGYQAAVLAELLPQGAVYSIEIVEELAQEAQKRLQGLGYKNIFVKHGDGYLGWPEHAPFDRIIVTAAPAEIPENLIAQLKVGGRMIVPVGTSSQELRLLTKVQGGVREEILLPVRFVPMVEKKYP